MKFKIVIWGHKLHSHTHSYIHSAFFKAFQYLGYETLWLDNSDDISSINFDNSLFITEGQVDQKIPLNKSSKYVIHNCKEEQYDGVKKLKLQVYTNGIENSSGVSGEKIEQCTYYDKEKNILYQPWATDLLPHEINGIYHEPQDKMSVWIGSFCGGYHGNDEEFQPYIQALKQHDYRMAVYHPGTCSFEENITVVRQHELAPSIVGRWQKVNGYVPCRIFKNISYGKLGLTNSKTVYELFEESVIFDENTYLMFLKYKNTSEEQRKNLFIHANNLIIHEHTYINRIKNLLKFI